MSATDFMGVLPGLPDPESEARFYDRVPTRRLVAWFVDFLIIFVITLPVWLVFGILTLGFGFVLYPLIMMAVSFLYRTMTIADKSATWGMRFMGIEFRRHDGTRFDLGTAAAHTAIYTVAVSFVILQIASIITILSTRYGQSLPDIVLRSTAINSPED